MAVKTVGEPPKSESKTCCDFGISQESSGFSVVPSRITSDSANGFCGDDPELPVETATLPSGRTATLLQTLPPSVPAGSVDQLASWLPVPWSNANTPPWTSGLSQREAMPTYTLPLATVGEPHA